VVNSSLELNVDRKTWIEGIRSHMQKEQKIILNFVFFVSQKASLILSSILQCIPEHISINKQLYSTSVELQNPSMHPVTSLVADVNL
jgi:hypothetical protein